MGAWSSQVELRCRWSRHHLCGSGHDIEQLAALMSKVPNGSSNPLAAHTVKGKGISFMEDDNNWHYRAPTADEVISAHKELGLL
jgi:transketolase